MPIDAPDLAPAAVFARGAIGKPWAAGAQGPQAYDCWGLARACQRVVFGRDLHVAGVDPMNLRAVIRAITESVLHETWCEVSTPSHGDLVTLGRHDNPHHIGVWLALDRGRILHSMQGAGVSFETLTMLKAAGWGRFRFYRFGGGA